MLSLLILLLAATALPGLHAEEASPVLVLIRPLVSQIDNLVELKKQGFLDPHIQVIALHHEDELSDYTPAREFAAREKLDWIRFMTIKGGISLDGASPARGRNEWTAQFQSVFDQSDGILFTGGMDLPPRLYGEETRLTTEASTPVRSFYEFSLLHHLVGDEDTPRKPPLPFLENRPEYAVLCICLGCQTLNAAAGGSLIQDIPSQVYGLDSCEEVLRQSPDEIHSSRYLSRLNAHIEASLPPVLHSIRGNGLGRITPKLGVSGCQNPLVLSSHHQALGRIGRGLLVTATSMDGRIVEAVEHERYPAVLGVQYHPENLSLYRPGKRFRKVAPFNPSRLVPSAEDSGRLGWLDYGPIGDHPDYSLRDNLEKTGSMTHHQALWHWFDDALHHSRKKR